MTPTLRLTLAALLALAGCSADAQPTAVPATPTPAATTANPAVVAECVEVQRAYNAWAEDHAAVSTAADVRDLNADTVGWTVEAGKSFYDAINGYDDEPVGALVVAVAEYNVETAFIAAWLTAGKQVSGKDADKVVDAAGKVHDAYRDFRARTCVGV